MTHNQQTDRPFNNLNGKELHTLSELVRRAITGRLGQTGIFQVKHRLHEAIICRIKDEFEEFSDIVTIIEDLEALYYLVHETEAAIMEDQ